ncbi:MAG TPA: hypothetical protein VIV40_36105 [Kofleriaceae bacterium]
MKLVVSVSIALALAAAPAVAQPDKQAPAEVTPSEARAWIDLFDKIVDTVVVNKDDCGKMAGSLNAVVDANQDAIRIARDAKAKGKKLPTTAQQHMLDGMRRMVGALDKCGRDEKVGAAFKRIDLGNRK